MSNIDFLTNFVENYYSTSGHWSTVDSDVEIVQ
jgi:hypothetical protein